MRATNCDLMRGKNFRRRKEEFFFLRPREALPDKFSNAGSERGIRSQLITAFYRRTRDGRVTGIYGKPGAEASVRLINCAPYPYSRANKKTILGRISSRAAGKGTLSQTRSAVRDIREQLKAAYKSSAHAGLYLRRQPRRRRRRRDKCRAFSRKRDRRKF
jgi:hypothetical protein